MPNNPRIKESDVIDVLANGPATSRQIRDALAARGVAVKTLSHMTSWLRDAENVSKSVVGYRENGRLMFRLTGKGA